MSASPTETDIETRSIHGHAIRIVRLVWPDGGTLYDVYLGGPGDDEECLTDDESLDHVPDDDEIAEILDGLGPRSYGSDHKPFSVAVTVRAVCSDRPALMEAARQSLLKGGASVSDVVDIMADWSAADALAELLGDGMPDGEDGDGNDEAGFTIVEMESSYSGEGEDDDLDDDEQEV